MTSSWGAPPLVEACCDSVQTARASQQYGAGRIELCGLGNGGTTPSLGMIMRCRDALRIPLHVMIRPHTNSFCYDHDDADVMRSDITAMKSLGVDGVVVGPLEHDHTIHVPQLAELVALARPMKVAFHRAFDSTPDAMESLEILLGLGVDYVLTSGHHPTALAGASTLRALHTRAGDRLTVLAGGNIRGDTVQQLIAQSRVREVHARATDPTIVRDVVKAMTEE